MKNTTVMNDVQGNQKVLEKDIEKRKTVKQKCIKHLMTGNCETKSIEFKTIKIPGSDSKVYAKLVKHKPANDEQKEFIKNLKNAVSKSVNEFEVFVNDPSIDGEGKLQFVPDYKPAVGYSYNELEELAEENGLRLGTKDEYILFLGWLINRLINEGWSKDDAWYAVCCNSTKLGHYWNAVDAKYGLEPTGSRMVAGKCDLGNVYKILAKEKAGGFWIAGGNCNINSDANPLANLNFYDLYDCHYNFSVGWFVI